MGRSRWGFSLLDPQPDRIPGAAEDARLLDRLEHDPVASPVFANLRADSIEQSRTMAAQLRAVALKHQQRQQAQRSDRHPQAGGRNRAELAHGQLGEQERRAPDRAQQHELRRPGAQLVRQHGVDAVRVGLHDGLGRSRQLLPLLGRGAAHAQGAQALTASGVVGSLPISGDSSQGQGSQATSATGSVGISGASSTRQDAMAGAAHAQVELSGTSVLIQALQGLSAAGIVADPSANRWGRVVVSVAPMAGASVRVGPISTATAESELT